jgi:hypothetical protein
VTHPPVVFALLMCSRLIPFFAVVDVVVNVVVDVVVDVVFWQWCLKKLLMRKFPCRG